MDNTGTPPEPLTAQEEQAVSQIIQQAEDKLTHDINAAVTRFNFGRSQTHAIPELDQ